MNKSPTNYRDSGNAGGNSGCVISPAPKLGLSAYQDPDIPIKPQTGKKSNDY
jgi:hypothetical protein